MRASVRSLWCLAVAAPALGVASTPLRAAHPDGDLPPNKVRAYATLAGNDPPSTTDLADLGIGEPDGQELGIMKETVHEACANA